MKKSTTKIVEGFSFITGFSINRSYTIDEL